MVAPCAAASAEAPGTPSGHTSGRAGRDGLVDRGRGRQRLVVDHGRLGAVLGGGDGLGHHQRDRLSREDHAIAREQHAMARRRHHVGQVLGREHAHHAGHRGGGGGVEARDASVRIGARHQSRVERARHPLVGAEAGGADDFLAAFEDRTGLADVRGLGGGHRSPIIGAGELRRYWPCGLLATRHPARA